MVKKTIKTLAPDRKWHKPRAIVGIGASAGGLEAVTEFLQNLPEKTGMAFVYVQHLDPTQKSFLVSILERISKISVVQAANNLRVEANTLYVIPPDKNMSIGAGTLRVVSRIAGNGRLVSIDNFFRSLAIDQKSRAIGVLLSGNASDGVLGMEAIKGAGGITLAQTPESAKHPSMPHSAIESGAADYVLVPADIAKEIAKISEHPIVSPLTNKELDEASLTNAEEESFKKIFAVLKVSTRVNFSQYKSPTLRRRMARRMILHKIATLPLYVEFLEKTPEESIALFQDLLINVTQFFRDSEIFEHLHKKVFPEILKSHPKGEPIRVWSAGCSTGEEPYSIAIALTELMEAHKVVIPMQIFGSDLNDQNIAKARAGIYSTSIATDVSPERLRRYFTKVDGHFQIAKAIRDVCIFAKQDLVNDPPFSQMDLIVCRNVLIYIEPVAQNMILRTFQYALRSSGYLLLGKSEGIGDFSDHFRTLSKTHKVFQKKSSAETMRDDGILSAVLHEFSPKAQPTRGLQSHKPFLKRSKSADIILSEKIDTILLSTHIVPPSLIIDEQMQIVQFRGDLSPFLSFPVGKATWNLLKIARDDLVMELRQAISDTKKTQSSVERKDVSVSFLGELQNIDITVMPLSRTETDEQLYVVIFKPSRVKTSIAADFTTGSDTSRPKNTDRLIDDLEHDLATAKVQLKSALETEEATREEFQSVNEEIVSANEELQSTNEELETAKEELQSTNEELVTVNEEMQTRNAELTHTNSDLMNVLSSVNVPIIIVDRELRIRRLTPIAEKTFNIVPTDIGRSIMDFNLSLHFPGLKQLLVAVIKNAEPQHVDVEDSSGRWHTLWVRPYMTWDNKIDGAVLTLIDIEDLKRSQETAQTALSFVEGILQTMREPLLVLDRDLTVIDANTAFYNTFETDPSQVVGVRIYNLSNNEWNKPELRTALEKVLPTKATFTDLEISFDFPRTGRKIMYLNGRKLLQGNTKEEQILITIENVTDHRILQERNDTFVSMASHELKTPVTTVKTLVQLLLKRFEESDDKMLVEYLTRMGQQIEHLSGLVTDLLDISKIKSGKLQLYEETFDMSILLKEIVENCQLLSQGHTILLDCKKKVVVSGDRDRLGQVLINLIVNAIKYSPKANKVKVSCTATKTDLTIAVQDFGIGIKHLHQLKIFERFFQVGNKVGQNFSGLGIGLYISADIIERHGGRIWVESKGNGSTFFFSVPLRHVKKSMLTKKLR